MVPIALGNDGAGSIRIPSAVCGTFGIKPGHGLVPQNRCHWYGMTENGPISTTVDDAATMLSVLANKKELAGAQAPDRRLNIALSMRPPLRGVKVDRAVKDAVVEVGEALQREGHRVIPDDPPYNASARTSAIVRWMAGALDDLELVDRSKLERRSRRHLRAGELALRFHLLRDAQAQRWHRRVMPMFDRYDVVLMPTLARVSLDVGPWSERSWLRNVWAALNFAPFTGLWNFAPFPAASVPASIHQGVPVGVQLVAGPGGEATILSLAKHIESVRPWTRHAPI
jgi:amidase